VKKHGAALTYCFRHRERRAERRLAETAIQCRAKPNAAKRNRQKANKSERPAGRKTARHGNRKERLTKQYSVKILMFFTEIKASIVSGVRLRIRQLKKQ
jgi:hypothetical protein